MAVQERGTHRNVAPADEGYAVNAGKAEHGPVELRADQPTFPPALGVPVEQPKAAAEEDDEGAEETERKPVRGQHAQRQGSQQ